MSELGSYVVVGASMAGGRAVEALRQNGYDGSVVLVGAESDRPYERPPLSKQYLQRRYPEDKLYLQPPGYYTEHDVALRLGVRAIGLDPDARTVRLDNGESLRYAALLIATGTQVRRLSVPGATLDGVHYLRTRADADRLAAALALAQRVVVVGAGFIGLEVAASARALGCEVVVLEAAQVPLARALGEEMGKVIAALHRDRGVDLRLGAVVKELRGTERVSEVVTVDGTAIACDLVVAGIGVTPAVDWLAGSGLALDNGVLVNEYGETNLPGVYAAGDVANYWHPLFGERFRVEHYDNALSQGLAVGKIMAGHRDPFTAVPSFWSDQYELTFDYVGHAAGDEQLVTRGNVEDRSFVSFYLRNARVRAAFGVGRPREIAPARKLITSQQIVDPAALVDPGVDLRALARGDLDKKEAQT